MSPEEFLREFGHLVETEGGPRQPIADATGRISPQTVTDLRKRLVAEEWVLSAGRRHTWAPDGKRRALDLLSSDYDRLALHLQLGR